MSVYLSVCFAPPCQPNKVLSAVKLSVPRRWDGEAMGVCLLSVRTSCTPTNTQTYIWVCTQMPTSTVPACVIIIFINYVKSCLNRVAAHSCRHTRNFHNTHAFLWSAVGLHMTCTAPANTLTQKHTGVWQCIAEGRKHISESDTKEKYLLNILIDIKLGEFLENKNKKPSQKNHEIAVIIV